MAIPPTASGLVDIILDELNTVVFYFPITIGDSISAVSAGTYSLSFSLPQAFALSRVMLKVTGGTGTATAQITANGSPVASAIAISTALSDTTPTGSAAARTQLDLVISNISGTVTEIRGQIEGIAS